MLRPVLTLAAIGFAGIALWKLVWVLLLPLVGMLVGFVGLVVKVLLIAGLLYLAYRLFRRVVGDRVMQD